MEKKDLKYSYNFLLEYKKAIDESSIVSKTDKNGLITFVNKKFCEISGYEEDELIGKSHNIVRHPSMTKEFFNNLWKTITNKEIFKGVIVNKKKNGTVYYVVTPEKSTLSLFANYRNLSVNLQSNFHYQ